MTGKIFRAIMVAAGGVLLAAILIIMGCMYDYFGSVQEKQLREELSLAAVGVESSGMEYLSSVAGETGRLTWIAADGSVLFDDAADEQSMENHAQREEVRQALETGEGYSQRYSSTLLEKTVYCAVRLSDGSVLRISMSRATMGMLAFGMLQPICIVLFAALLLAFFLASRLSKRIVEPLNRLDLDNPLDNKTYDELAPLLTRISQQRRQIDAQLRQLRRRQDEFEQITASMSEGLVLLDNSGVILSINPAAAKLFSASSDAVGQDLLTIERSMNVSEAMEHARRSGHAEISITRAGREYQIDFSRIESDGAAVGVVLLTFDVTERAFAEKARREFTANVSHELKTPLTAILGSSEMIESGMVKPEDMPRFVGHIHSEAARLLTLIEDIIRLSQLDEGVPLPMEPVDLGDAVQQAASQLGDKARQSMVSVNVSTEPCRIKAVPRLVHEIVYNLTENAIKYNVEGGSVSLTVTSDGVFTVSDTGIGIAPEHQTRVFERFYRVDKSHSKAIGGTGLGLSIVKHACAYLGAQIELQSQPGSGTTISVRFEK